MVRLGAVLLAFAAAAPLSLALLLATAILFYVADGEGPSGDPWVEALLAVLPLGTAITLAVTARWRGPRGGVAAAALLAAAGAALLTTVHFWGAAIVPGDDVQRVLPTWDAVARGQVDVRRLGLTLAPVVVGLAIVACRGRRFARAEVGAMTALGVSVMAVLLVLPRAGAPSPSRYLLTLEPAIPIEGRRAFHLDGREYRIETTSGRAMPPRWRIPSDHEEREERGCVLVGPAGALPLGNLFYETECSLGWDPHSHAARPHVPSAVYTDDRGDYAVLYQPECTGPYLERAFVRLDPRSAPSLCDGCSTYALALRVRDGERVALDVARLSDRLGPPPLMSGIAVMGVLVASALFRVARGLRRRARATSGRDATHEGDGVVHVDGQLVHVEGAAVLPAGAVLLPASPDLDPPGGSSPFRDRPRYAGAVAGDLATLRAGLEDRAAALEVAALVIALLSAAPLIGAHAAGL
ncbi:MAG: hypothetical protein KF894_12705 [Labilithrix sp.]|nr:hypothetical protein [Labilithrix sp.]